MLFSTTIFDHMRINANLFTYLIGLNLFPVFEFYCYFEYQVPFDKSHELLLFPHPARKLTLELDDDMIKILYVTHLEMCYNYLSGQREQSKEEDKEEEEQRANSPIVQ